MHVQRCFLQLDFEKQAAVLHRKRREQAEDSRQDHKPKFIQPHKECQCAIQSPGDFV